MISVKEILEFLHSHAMGILKQDMPKLKKGHPL